MLNKIKKAQDYINKIYGYEFDLGIILGTGLKSLTDSIKNKIIIKYEDIPGFPITTVIGHSGEFIIGYLQNKRVIAFNGRFHYYEGNNMDNVVFPIRLLKSLNVDKVIITNAAGGMNPSFSLGDLMIITDHINMMGTNPLIGLQYNELGCNFPDMSRAYDVDLIDLAINCSKKLSIDLKTGIYLGVMGPCYETSSELRMMRLLGGDAVGMSTVPEVIAAVQCGIKVLGISCITDIAIAEDLKPLNHYDVLKVANTSTKNLIGLVKNVVKNMQ